MSLLLPSTRSENGSPDERRSAIYLSDGLAVKLLCVCDATAGMESSEPSSLIHSDLDDLWSNILASSSSSVDSPEAEEVIRRFAERYGLVPCLEGSNLNLLDAVENIETPSEDLYKELLEAAFGSSSCRTSFENEYRNTALRIGAPFFNLNHDEVDDPNQLTPQNTHYSPSLDLPEAHSPLEAPRFYYNRPHTPQVIRVDLSQKDSYDVWTIPNLMKKPSLFPPTPRNIRDWIFWRRVHGRR